MTRANAKKMYKQLVATYELFTPGPVGDMDPVERELLRRIDSAIAAVSMIARPRKKE